MHVSRPFAGVLALLSSSYVAAKPVVHSLISREDLARGGVDLDELYPRQEGQCHPMGMKFGESRWDCPRNNGINPDGTCLSHVSLTQEKKGCTSYCEERITLKLGQERPFDFFCRFVSPCVLTTGLTISQTTGFSINLGFTGGKDGGGGAKSAFDLGASWQWSTTVASTAGSGWTWTYNATEKYATRCGYWTFIPYLIESCGTLTESELGDRCANAGWKQECTGGEYCNTKVMTRNIKNWCNTVSVPKSGTNTGGGDTMGAVVFVRQDCETNKVFQDGQDPIYYHPGVSIHKDWVGRPENAVKNGYS